MKVLIFSTAYFPHVGGAEVAVKEITNRLSSRHSGTSDGKAEFSFDMITVRLSRKDIKEEQIDNVKVHRVGWGIGRIDKLLFPFRAVSLADKLHQRHNYSVVWSIMASFSGFAALFFKKKNPEVKFLLTLQEGDDLRVPERKSFLVHGWFKQIFQRADYVQCISTHLAEWAKHMGVKCPVEVVPNGVNQPSAGSHQPEAIKKRLGIRDDEKVILTTSRLVEKNRIEDLIEAFKILNIKYSIFNIHLVICGSGALEDKLKQLTKDLNIEDKVKFLGFVQPEELPKYYAIADVFCRPSLSEGLGNSFLEAMAAGVPVIGTPVGGIPDFLEDEKSSFAKATADKTGWFCKVKDPKSIAEKIKYVLDKENKDEMAKVVENAKRMIEEKYNWNKIAIQMKNIFNKLSN